MADTNYGMDLSCTDSVEVSRYVYGPELVGQALYRRLITPRGTLSGGAQEQAYGLDLSALIGANPSESLLASLPSRISNECLKDPRVSDVSVTYQVQTAQSLTTVTFQIEATLQDGQTFSLQILSSGVSSQLLGIQG